MIFIIKMYLREITESSNLLKVQAGNNRMIILFLIFSIYKSFNNLRARVICDWIEAISWVFICFNKDIAIQA